MALADNQVDAINALFQGTGDPDDEYIGRLMNEFAEAQSSVLWIVQEHRRLQPGDTDLDNTTIMGILVRNKRQFKDTATALSDLLDNFVLPPAE